MDGRLRCTLCDAVLARDQPDPYLCSPCRRGRRDYDPRRDPAFRSTLLVCFTSRPGVLIDPVAAMGLGCEWHGYVKAVMRSLRREGHVFCAVPRSRGYRYVGSVPVRHG